MQYFGIKKRFYVENSAVSTKNFRIKILKAGVDFRIDLPAVKLSTRTAVTPRGRASREVCLASEAILEGQHLLHSRLLLKANSSSAPIFTESSSQLQVLKKTYLKK